MKIKIIVSIVTLFMVVLTLSCSKTTDDLKIKSTNIDQKDQVEVLTETNEIIDPGQLYQKGLVYLRNNDINEAEKYLLLAVSKNQKYFMGYNLLAQYYLSHKHFNVAMEYYNKALECYPKCHIAYAGIGDIYYMQNDTDKAIENLKKAIELKPDYTMVYFALSKVYAQNGNKKAAIDTLLKCKILSPKDSEQADQLIQKYKKG